MGGSRVCSVSGEALRVEGYSLGGRHPVIVYYAPTILRIHGGGPPKVFEVLGFRALDGVYWVAQAAGL